MRDFIQRLRRHPLPPGSLYVHTEVHRMIEALGDAAGLFATLCDIPMDGFTADEVAVAEERIIQAYGRMQTGKRELHQWIVAHTPVPTEAYLLHLRF